MQRIPAPSIRYKSFLRGCMSNSRLSCCPRRISYRLASQYNSRFNDIVFDDTPLNANIISSTKFDIVGNKYKLKHECSACHSSQHVEVIKLSYHRGCVVIKCSNCAHVDLFSDHMFYFRTKDYAKELSQFETSKYAKDFIKVEENNVTQITQIDFSKKKKVVSSRMAGFWEDSEWDDSKGFKM
jgi:hypothetical protein